MQHAAPTSLTTASLRGVYTATAGRSPGPRGALARRSRVRGGTARNPLLTVLAAALTLAVVLTGCGKAPPPAPAPRPVLVVRPAGDTDVAFSAYSGTVRAREESTLSFRVGGNLVTRNVDAGARVKRGDVLATIDPGDLALQAQAQRAQLAAAEADLARASGDRARYAKLVDSQLISRSAYDAQDAAFKAAQGQATAARAQLDVARNQQGYSQLRAPRDGVIASREAEAGQVVAAGQAIYTLAADGGREVAIDLPEDRIGQFRIGQPVLVELWNAPGKRLPGTLRELSPAADAQTRTFAARVSLASEDLGAVELGQSARVYIQDAGAQAALSVPLSAVQRGSAPGQDTVWVVDPEDGRVHAVPVRLGVFGAERVPVLGGLAADALVVAAGGHLLREGEAVAPVDRGNRPVAAEPSAAPPAAPRAQGN